MIVNIQNLNFSYYLKQNNILKNININIDEGKRILLTGINGAGKSTLLRIMAGKHLAFNVSTFKIVGFRTPQNGFGGISYIGDDWTKKVNFVGNVAYSIDMPVKNFMKKDQDENLDRRNFICKLLKINLDWNMSQLSDGQRRKVQIMLGLLKPFKLLLLDEVTSELDIVVRKNLIRFLKNESTDRKATIIYATHIFDGLDDWVNDVIYLNYNGTIDDINIKNKNLKDIIYNKMIIDYDLMESHNIKEDEGNKKQNIKLYGPQGGYSSGRSRNINI